MTPDQFFDGNEPVDLSNVIYVFGDVETTGLSPDKGDRMTEYALIATNANFEVLDTITDFINPEQTISAQITEITKITNEMVEGADKYDEAIPHIVDWYKSLKENLVDYEVSKIVFVAHNAPFDIKFFNHASQLILGEDMITDFIDTVSLARELYPFWRNHKLDTCAKKFGVVNDNHHRAENDTIVLMNIGKRLITEALDTNLNPLNFITKKNLHYKN